MIISPALLFWSRLPFAVPAEVGSQDKATKWAPNSFTDSATYSRGIYGALKESEASFDLVLICF